MFHVAILTRGCGDKQERKDYDSTVMCLCVKSTRGQLCCLVLVVVTQIRVSWEEETSVEEFPHQTGLWA